MLFDLRTLMVFIAAAHLLFGLLLLADGRARSGHRELEIWSASNMVGALAWLLIALRGQIPDWLSIPVGNALLLLAWSLLWAGMRQFSGRQFSRWAVALPGLVVLVLFLWVPPVRDNLVARIVVTNLGLMLCLLAVGWDALRDGRVDPLRARRVVVLALLGAVISNCVRVVLSVSVDPQSSFLAPNRGKRSASSSRAWPCWAGTSA